MHLPARALYILPLLLLLLLASCATDTSSFSSATGNTSDYSAFLDNAKPAPPLRGSITRSQAIRHALTYSPVLQAQRAELRALEAEIVQAGLPPNPEIGLEVENFAGSGGTRGFDGAEITAAISQRLETGGKRSKRTLVAGLNAEALRAELAAGEREVRIAVDRAFTTLAEAREVRTLSERNLERAENNLNALESLLDAGKSNRIDVAKAKLAVSEARELIAEARSEESSAAADLSQTWGGGAADVTASGSLNSPSGGSSFAGESALKRHPAMKAAALRFARAQAAYDLEKARRFSDVDVGGGVRQLRDADETAAVFGVSVPLPIFDRNQGNIQAAKERLGRAEAEARAIKSELLSQLTRYTSDLKTARTRAAEFDSQTIAAARQALEDTQEAYDAGKASLLEVLDARETLFEVERGRARAMADLLRAHHSLLTLTQH